MTVTRTVIDLGSGEQRAVDKPLLYIGDLLKAEEHFIAGEALLSDDVRATRPARVYRPERWAVAEPMVRGLSAGGVWFRTCGSAILVMLRKTGLSETDQCTTEQGLGRILSSRPPVDSNSVTSGPAEVDPVLCAPPGPATNTGGAGGRPSSAGAAFGAGNATPNSTPVARQVRPAATEPTTRSLRSCGPAFPR